MGNYENLKQSITEVIRTNGNQEITGSILQNVLLTIISTVGANATFAGIATPTTNPGTPDGPVFYLASEGGTYSNFDAIELQDGLSVLMWNGSWSSHQIFSIDDVPTAGSDNLVKSNGVQEELALGAVYDVSAKNPTAGPNNDGKFESLSTLLEGANLDTLIPASVRRGGMSIKFVQSSDDKYVQYRLMSDTFNTTSANWQGVDDEPTAGSDNLVKSGSVAKIIETKEKITSKAIFDLENKIKEAKALLEQNLDNLANAVEKTNIKTETKEKITSKAIFDLENKIKEANIKTETKEKITSKALLGLNTNVKESSKTSVIYEGGCIVPFDLLNEQYLEKVGVVVNFGDEGGDFDSIMVESPCIWYEPSLQKLIMIYTAYRHSDELIGCHAYATSEDGVLWEKQGLFYTPSNINDTPDRKSITGPVMVINQDKYYLFYIGCTEGGYEQGEKTLCLAIGNSISDFINNTAERKGTIIATGNGWASRQIWHPCFIKTPDKWYCFINASGDVNGRNDKERIGFYYSDKLDGNWVQGEQVLKYIDESTRGTQIAIDPSIVSYGDFYIMMYGTVLSSNNKAYDHWAFTSKKDFPFGWKYGGVGVSPTENYDDRYAHKPWLMKFRNKIYHYYTSVGVNGNRTIALIY